MNVAERIQAHRDSGKFIDAGGSNTFVCEQGSGSPVLLLHGVPASSYLYRKMIPLLAEAGCRAISFDFIGAGFSDKSPEVDYDWHALADHLDRVVKALQLEQVHLVVHDIAGPIGIEWAIKNPERVKSITVLNTLLNVEVFSPPFPMWTYRVPWLRQIVVNTQSATLFHAIMKRIGVKDTTKLDKADTAAYLSLMTSDGGKSSFLKVMAGFDLSTEHTTFLREGLQRITKPIQVVWGEHEVAIPEEQRRYVVDNFKPLHVHLVPGRHFIQEDNAEQVSLHIDAFRREVEG